MSNVLIGKTILEIKVNHDKTGVLFVTNEGDVMAKCDADCCSFTWIEHMTLPALGCPALVTSVEDLDMPDLGDMPDCEVIAYYGCKISTNKGEIVIDYRNDSNGYYGGDLSWPGDHFYGGVYGQNVPKENWSLINDDF